MTCKHTYVITITNTWYESKNIISPSGIPGNRVGMQYYDKQRICTTCSNIQYMGGTKRRWRDDDHYGITDKEYYSK